MNALLLEQPIYINRLFITIAGEVEAGIFLDHLFKKFSASKNTSIELTPRSIYNDLYFYDFEIPKLNKKLSRLPFLSIQKTSEEAYCYEVDLEKYEIYLQERFDK